LINLGAYGPIKNILKRFVNDDKQATIKFIRNITAGCLSGTIAAVASNPVDLCKTKLQAKNSPYTSSFHVIRDVIQHHGVKGLWVYQQRFEPVRQKLYKCAQCLIFFSFSSCFNRYTMCNI
jgi:hypothetical protein